MPAAHGCPGSSYSSEVTAFRLDKNLKITPRCKNFQISENPAAEALAGCASCAGSGRPHLSSLGFWAESGLLKKDARLRAKKRALGSDFGSIL